MNAKNGITRKALKEAVGNHLLRATVLACFFSRLKDQVNGALEVFGFGQVLGRTQQHGRVAVMSTGVHGASMFAGVRLLGFFLNGQCIHVSP